MVSVVHCPLTLYSTLNASSSPLGNGAKGSKTAKRSEVGETLTGALGSGTPAVGMNAGLPCANPADGRSEPWGGEKRNSEPSDVGMVSVRGLKVVLPA